MRGPAHLATTAVAGVVLMLAGVVASAEAETSVRGSVLAVNVVDDPAPNGCTESHCSLREAVLDANALPGDDTIVLPAGAYMLTIRGADEDASATGDLDVVTTATAGLVVAGSGSGSTTIDAAGLGDRVFHVIGEGAATIEGVTVTGGDANAATLGGGGVLNRARLTLEDVVVTGNQAYRGGGAANVDGTLTVAASTISGNVTSSVTGSGGGGLWNHRGGLTVRQSAIRDNSAPNSEGGGLLNSGGDAAVFESALTGNSGGFSGGAIASEDDGTQASLALTNVTVSGNSAGAGGGVVVQGNSLSISSSTLYGNSDDEFLTGANLWAGSGAVVTNTVIGGSPSGPNCTGGVTSNGHNLEDQNTCGLTGAGDLVSTDPLLDPLADNGGSTQTHALRAGSPAIDAGLGCPETDQRGVTRPQGAGCDIGAYESDAAPPPPPPPPAAPCIVVRPATPVDFGARAFSAPGAIVQAYGMPAVEVENCGSSSAEIHAHGGNASGGGTTWTLSSSADPCAAGINVFGLALGALALTSNDQLVARLDPGVTRTEFLQLTMPCAGSGGTGSTLQMQVVFTATA